MTANNDDSSSTPTAAFQAIATEIARWANRGGVREEITTPFVESINGAADIKTMAARFVNWSRTGTALLPETFDVSGSQPAKAWFFESAAIRLAAFANQAAQVFATNLGRIDWTDQPPAIRDAYDQAIELLSQVMSQALFIEALTGLAKEYVGLIALVGTTTQDGSEPNWQTWGSGSAEGVYRSLRE